MLEHQAELLSAAASAAMQDDRDVATALRDDRDGIGAAASTDGHRAGGRARLDCSGGHPARERRSGRRGREPIGADRRAP